jgi:hypothetical protein
MMEFTANVEVSRDQIGRCGIKAIASDSSERCMKKALRPNQNRAFTAKLPLASTNDRIALKCRSHLEIEAIK